MKPNADTKAWLARIGRKGGQAGSVNDKRKAAQARWAKRKTISRNPAGK